MENSAITPFLLMLFSGVFAFGNSVQAGESHNENYHLPSLLQAHAPVYPYNERMSGREAWVNLRFAVDENGKATDIIVDDSTGITSFEKASIAALKKFRYSPATFNGKAVKHYCMDNQFTFMMTSGRGASQRFSAKYRKANRLINKKKLEEARNLIKELANRKKNNLYEEVYFWHLKAVYQYETGDYAGALKSLTKATQFDSNNIRQREKAKQTTSPKQKNYTSKPYLPPKTYQTALKHLFQLQLKERLYKDALDTFELYQLVSSDEDTLSDLQGYAEKINTLINDNSLITTRGEVSDRSFWRYRLLRRGFFIDNIDGNIEKLQVRCERRAFTTSNIVDQTWQVPASFGDCNIYIYGSEGTKFSLLELPIDSKTHVER